MSAEAPLQLAIKWINGQLKLEPSANKLKLIDEASQTFNLSPGNSQFLIENAKKLGTEEAF